MVITVLIVLKLRLLLGLPGMMAVLVWPGYPPGNEKFSCAPLSAHEPRVGSASIEPTPP